MNRVEEGIANYKHFQNVVSAFITRADTRDEERIKFQEQRDKELKAAVQRREGRQNRWFAILGITVAILTLLVAYLAYRDSKRKLSEIAPTTISQSHTDAGNSTAYTSAIQH